MGQAENDQLFFALKQRDFDGVRRSLASGADAKARARDVVAHCAPLHIVVRSWSLRIAEALVGAGAEIDPVDQRGWTPLHWARFADEITWLLDHGAAVDALTAEGETKAMLVAAGGAARTRAADYRLLVLLRDRGADLRRRTSQGKTLLHFAARNSSSPPAEGDDEPPAARAPDAILRLGLDSGIPLDAPDAAGVTPLMEAVLESRVDNVAALLELGARCDPALLDAASDEKVRALVRARLAGTDPNAAAPPASPAPPEPPSPVAPVERTRKRR